MADPFQFMRSVSTMSVMCWMSQLMHAKLRAVKLRRARLCAWSIYAHALFAATALLQGCASNIPSADTSPVAGWRFQIAMKFPSQQRYELFRITPTGEIQYGGGMSAMNDYTTWETALTPEQASEFVALADSLSWIKQVPKETGDDKTEPVFVVKYQQHGGSERNFAIRGNTPETDKVIAFMKNLTQRRFQSTLQKLPEATEKPKAPATPASATPPLSPASAPASATQPTQAPAQTPAQAPAQTPAQAPTQTPATQPATTPTLTPAQMPPNKSPSTQTPRT